MTLLVLDLALAQCARWRAQGHQLSVAVNLSARNLLDLRLPTDVSRLLRQHGLPARALTLELTESAIMADPEHARQVLADLRGLGVRISIDDYGTGYSSLAYLGRLAVDELKIDRSFSIGMEADDHSRAIIRSTIALAHELGLEVVAEGVETQAAWDWLAARAMRHRPGPPAEHAGRPGGVRSAARRALQRRRYGRCGAALQRGAAELPV